MPKLLSIGMATSVLQVVGLQEPPKNTINIEDMFLI